MYFLFTPKGNTTFTKAMEEYTADKINHLSKYIFIPDDATCHVVAKIYKDEQKVEIGIPSLDLRAEASHADYYAAVNLAVSRLEGQIRKIKTKEQKLDDSSLHFLPDYQSFPFEVWLASVEIPEHPYGELTISLANEDLIVGDIDVEGDWKNEICGIWHDYVQSHPDTKPEHITDMYIS